MSTKFNMTKDIAGYNGFGVKPTKDIQGVSLPISTAKTFTAPSNYPFWLAIISYTPGANVFVDFTGATAAAPTTTVSKVTSSLNPAGRVVTSGQTFSAITPDATNPYMTVEYQVINPYTN